MIALAALAFKLTAHCRKLNNYVLAHNSLAMQAVEFGRIELVDYMNRVIGYNFAKYSDRFLTAATASAQFAIFRYLREHAECTHLSSLILCELLRRGDLEWIRYLYAEFAAAEINRQCKKWAVEICIAHGDMEILQFLREKHPDLFKLSTRHVVCAAESGSIECLKYVHANVSKFAWAQSTRSIVAYSAKSGSIECVKYACENGAPLVFEACIAAATMDKPECLQYLLDNGCPCGNYAVYCAARSGSVECLRILHKSGKCTIDDDAYEHAAASGSTKCMKFIHEVTHVAPDIRACRAAANTGNIKCLRFIWSLYAKGSIKAAVAWDAAAIRKNAKRFGWTSCRDISIGAHKPGLCPFGARSCPLK